MSTRNGVCLLLCSIPRVWAVRGSRMGLVGYWMNGRPSRWLIPSHSLMQSRQMATSKASPIRCHRQQNFVPQSQCEDQSQPICPPWCPLLPGSLTTEGPIQTGTVFEACVPQQEAVWFSPFMGNFCYGTDCNC